MIDFDLYTKSNGDKKTPLYEKIYRYLKEEIISGRIKAGEKLPSKRVFALDNGVSVITVDSAYSLLIDEGFVYSKERSGFFVRETDVPYTSSKKTGELAAKSTPAIPEGFQFGTLLKIMRKVITEYDKALLLKSPPLGCENLRCAIAEYLYRYRAFKVNPENIVIGSGSEYFYGMIVSLLGRNRIYGLEYPSYEKIASVISTNGAKCEFLKMGEDGIKTKELEKTAATVLHVTPFNSYPTGITAPYSKRTEYIRWAKERDGFIVEDDIDSEFAVGAKPVETIYSLSNAKRVIYLNTFSKSLAPSMRMGYMILPGDLLKEYKEKLGFYSCTVPTFDQYVLAEFISQGYFERHLNRIRRQLKDKPKN